MRKKTSGRSKIVVGEAKRKQTGLLFFQSKCCMFAHPYSLTRLLNHPSNLLRNMKTKQLLMLGFLAIVLAACGAKSKKTNEMGKRTQVKIETTQGDILVELYNETPQHRDNFIKLVKEGQYEGLLFHRVIKDFMIQGGDVTSKDAPMNKQLGAGDLGYTVPAEFKYPTYFHKKGALCAARTGDEVNPERASSASQFYIVTGKKYPESELNQMEKQLDIRLKQEIFNRLQTENRTKIMELYRSGNKEELAILRDTLIGKTELEAERRKEEAKIPAEIREIYKTIGGVPFLDNQYTVYGEVIEGIEVVDAIQQVKTNKQDRPTENVIIKSVKIME